jgi:hypothetical protein
MRNIKGASFNGFCYSFYCTVYRTANCVILHFNVHETVRLSTTSADNNSGRIVPWDDAESVDIDCPYCSEVNSDNDSHFCNHRSKRSKIASDGTY